MYSSSVRRAVLRVRVARGVPEARKSCSSSYSQLQARFLSTEPEHARRTSTPEATASTSSTIPAGTQVDFPESVEKHSGEKDEQSIRTLRGQMLSLLQSAGQGSNLIAQSSSSASKRAEGSEDEESHMVHYKPSRRIALRVQGAKDLPTIFAAVYEVERRFGRIRDYWITTVHFCLLLHVTLFLF